MKPTSLGIIGCGNVLDAYLPACRKLESQGVAELVIACGRESQAKRVASLGISKFTTHEIDVLSSSSVEAVVILTSMPEHARLVRAALEAGKHVLVEKPLALDLDEAEALVQLAKSRGRLLLAAPFTVLSPTFQTLSRRLDAGDIGKPCSARARYGWAGPDWSGWFYGPGGGCLFDLAVYCVTTLTGLLGPARRVMAMTGTAIPNRDIEGKSVRVEAEDNAQVLLDFGESCFAVVTSGFVMQQYRCPAVEIYGSTGTIQMLGDDWHPEGYELWQNAAGAWQCYKDAAPNWSWTDGLGHWIDCIREGKPPLATAEHACHVLEIMLQAKASGAQGQSLPLRTTFQRPSFEAQVHAAPAHLQHDRTRDERSSKSRN